MKTYDSTHNDGKHIFVFGSNLAGIHGAGAALEARVIWGAVQGNGHGRTGQAYAIPTKDRYLDVLTLPSIEVFVRSFIKYAREHPELTFLVTRIGCGLAGYSDFDIAPMFWNAPANCELPDGWRVRRGWRRFHCEDCEHVWEESTRDHTSPSCETCPGCGCDVHPNESRSDASLKTDDMGNLV